MDGRLLSRPRISSVPMVKMRVPVRPLLGRRRRRSRNGRWGGGGNKHGNGQCNNTDDDDDDGVKGWGYGEGWRGCSDRLFMDSPPIRQVPWPRD